MDCQSGPLVCTLKSRSGSGLLLTREGGALHGPRAPTGEPAWRLTHSPPSSSALPGATTSRATGHLPWSVMALALVLLSSHSVPCSSYSGCASFRDGKLPRAVLGHRLCIPGHFLTAGPARISHTGDRPMGHRRHVLRVNVTGVRGLRGSTSWAGTWARRWEGGEAGDVVKDTEELERGTGTSSPCTV